jgi:hypothetical protein
VGDALAQMAAILPDRVALKKGAALWTTGMLYRSSCSLQRCPITGHYCNGGSGTVWVCRNTPRTSSYRGAGRRRNYFMVE